MNATWAGPISAKNWRGPSAPRTAARCTPFWIPAPTCCGYRRIGSAAPNGIARPNCCWSTPTLPLLADNGIRAALRRQARRFEIQIQVCSPGRLDARRDSTFGPTPIKCSIHPRRIIAEWALPTGGSTRHSEAAKLSQLQSGTSALSSLVPRWDFAAAADGCC